MGPIRFEIDQAVARITLAAPESGNALNTILVEGLLHALAQAENDPNCRVIVLSAEGTYFCQGLDTEEAFTKDGQPNRALLERLLQVAKTIRSSRMPVIACVDGHVNGGGIGLVAVADIVIAAPTATFMLPEVIVGMIPAVVGVFLLRRITPARLGYLASSTRGIRGLEAREMGLVDELADNGVEHALEMQLKRLLRSSPRSLAETKRYLETLTPNDFSTQATMALEKLYAWLSDPEVIEGIRVFTEGGAPPWFSKYERRHHNGWKGKKTS